MYQQAQGIEFMIPLLTKLAVLSLENLGRKIVLFPSLLVDFFFFYFFVESVSLPSLFLNYFLLYFFVLVLNRIFLTWF